MNKQLYYRLIALWVLCEAMLGGIIHGLKMPVSGLIVGSCAVLCICLIAWYIPQKGAILKATIIVAVFKMMLSPQAPPPAYIAVFFQGILGELLFFSNRKYFRLSCILLAVLALLESGLQRILVLTIVYGNDLWKVINDFINGLTKQKKATNYSLFIGAVYVLIHLITGLFVGYIASVLPARIKKWSSDKELSIPTNPAANILPATSQKRKKLKKGLFIIWLVLLLLFIQSYFQIGKPLLPAQVVVRIIVRSLLIILSWIFIVGPVLKKLLHHWLRQKKSKQKEEVQAVLQLLPATQQLLIQSWQHTAGLDFFNRIKKTGKIILARTFDPFSPVYILTAPIQSGKTTALLKWLENRNDVSGILTPIVEGKRVFLNIQSKEQFPMEATPGETAILSIGKFEFSKNSFDKAIRVIRNAADKKGWLIIDEIGPLELRGEGFAGILKELLAKRTEKILLVVRDKDEMVKKISVFTDGRDTIILNNPADLVSL